MPNGQSITNPATNDFRVIDRVEAIFINLASQRINGVDAELRYTTDLNLLDKDPNLTPGTIGRTGVGLGVSGIYAIPGRRYTLGVNYEF